MIRETELSKEIVALAAQIGGLHGRAHAEYAAIVKEILQSGICNTCHIERTLDGLLDFCGNDAVLLLFRRLCQYYFASSPASAVGYVNAYREMYKSHDGAEVGK